VKPQSAFFEALGQDGYLSLKRTVDAARASGLLVLVDVKRSDIGSTAAAYAAAVFTRRGLDADAVTVVPYFGIDGIAPFKRYVREDDKGLFVVVHSSNPSAKETQDVGLDDGSPYFHHIANLVDEWGSDCVGTSGYSAIGAVVGATYPVQLADVRVAHPTVPILIPGYGSQGATAADAAAGFIGTPGGALVAASRSICDVEGMPTHDQYVRAVRTNAERMVHELRLATNPRALPLQPGNPPHR
jgi:orotidine-5'-phosphate decarboxylase